MDIKVDIKKFENDIRSLEKISAEAVDILFYGSSTFTVWGQMRLSQQISDMGSVLNHGFGGSTAEEALYFYPRMVRPYSPKKLVWYEGDNDIACGYTPKEAFDLSLRVFEWAKSDFSGIKLYLVSVKHCPLRQKNVDLYDEYNALLKKHAESNENVYYVDIIPMCYDNFNNIRTDIFKEDMLHFNDKGYEEFSEIIKRRLV